MTISDGSLAIDEPVATPEDDVSPTPVDEAITEATSDEQALQKRLTAWLDVGATSIPALLVALGSAVGGTLMVFLRRRRRRA